jgi:hypothetical protein
VRRDNRSGHVRWRTVDDRTIAGGRLTARARTIGVAI